MRNRFLFSLLFTAVFCSAAVFSLSGCTESESKTVVETVRPVKTMVVEQREAYHIFKYPGKVQAGRRVDLSFRVAGPLVDLPVKPGQEVKKGDLLAEIDPRDFKTALDSARAAETYARDQFNRYNKLYSRGAVSKSAYDSAKTSYTQAQSALEQAQSALKDARLYAPFSGTIAKTYVENHQDVQAKQTIVSLQDMSSLEVVVQIPEKDVLSSSDPHGYELSVVLEGDPEKAFPARIGEFNTVADSQTQTFSVTVVMERPEGMNVFPGMTAELQARAKVFASETEQHFFVPVEAVLVDENKASMVWAIDRETMTAHRQPVQVGELTGDCAVIQEGIGVGDMIAVAGVHHLRENMKVSSLETKSGGCGR